MADEKAMNVRYVEFRYHEASWDGKTPQGWTATARFNGSGACKDLAIELPITMGTEIMRLLAPILAKQAAIEAQKLALETTKIADDLVKQIEEKCKAE
jgi:hypothetical protein